MALDLKTLMTTRIDCMNADRMSDGEAACSCLMDCFRSNEASTVVSNVSQLARLIMSEGEIFRIASSGLKKCS